LYFGPHPEFSAARNPGPPGVVSLQTVNAHAFITGVAICPHPPLLIPQIAAGAAGEADGLRAACDQAVAWLLGSDPEQVVVVGPQAPTKGVRAFAPGVDGLNFAGAERPLALAVGGWLLDRARTDVRRSFVVVRPDGAPTTEWPDLSVPTALLVMGDGSARRSAKGPGYLDERAAPFDADLVKALATADVDKLANLDPVLCEQLLVGGVGAFKALATLAGQAPWQAELRYDEAPYGVQYTVALWARS